ncbi:MAG TPA: glycosyltransferase [Steroidobacteraceae bacterium]|nr:glycosyltransferase [Steroidobacteraceae bacterium]HQX77958.1 glycosyltransferase [Steroidobacteraceae bacterium]
MRISLVVTTYERPDALAAVLATVAAQQRAPDEVLVADDGSGAATRAVVDRFAAHSRAPVAYIRQEHAGFRVARLRNLAIAASRGDYLVLIDGDMLLHADFIGDHEAVARPGAFVQGMRIPLDDPGTQAALATPALPVRRATPRGVGGLRRLYGLRSPLLARTCVKLANPVVALKSCNFALWRDDLIAVNGFNEDFVGWGPEDKEFAARLTHSGCSRRTLVFGGIAWHLHHPPASRDRRAANEARLAATLANRTIRCRHGLDAHPANTAAWL